MKEETRGLFLAVILSVIAILPNVCYVLIGRHNTATRDFAKLKEEMIIALKRINKLLTKEKTAHEKAPDSAADSAD